MNRWDGIPSEGVVDSAAEVIMDTASECEVCLS